MSRKRLRKRLTESTDLPTRTKPYRAWDVGSKSVRCLHVPVLPTGTRSYRLLYRLKDSPKEHVLHLGRVGEITLADARAKALEVRKAAAAGDNPEPPEPNHTTPTPSRRALPCHTVREPNAAPMRGHGSQGHHLPHVRLMRVPALGRLPSIAVVHAGAAG